MDDVLQNLDVLFERPQTLGSATPGEWYKSLCDYGYDVKPLGGGNFKGVPFEQGGGFRVNWGGDRVFLYHPPYRTHHGKEPYYKLSMGNHAILRFNLDGSPRIDWE